MVGIRGRVGGNFGSRTVFSRAVGSGRPLRAGDVSGIVGRFQRFAAAVLDSVPGITKEALEPAFEKSKVYCPKKTHDLVNSGYLKVRGRLRAGVGGPQTIVEMGYAKGGFPYYALIVHEVMSYYHKPPTRAKWLQVAMQEEASTVLPAIAARLTV